MVWCLVSNDQKRLSGIGPISRQNGSLAHGGPLRTRTKQSPFALGAVAGAGAGAGATCYPGLVRKALRLRAQQMVHGQGGRFHLPVSQVRAVAEIDNSMIRLDGKEEEGRTPCVRVTVSRTNVGISITSRNASVRNGEPN
ncbi:hypothetical protein M0804_011803 [Polistes exclamans]|nr:hypothetical protein M0804_011803 [Polistes exclamans]